MRDQIANSLQRIDAARSMTHSLLDGLAPEEWFWQPAKGHNPVIWHVGHLAFAEYFLCLKRLRGRTLEDEDLVTTKFLKKYKQGSMPSGDPEVNYTPDEVLATLAAIHARAHEELAAAADAELDVPSAPPHPVFETKLGALAWCSQHEAMHGGQITLLRRLMGKSPRW